MQNVPEMLPIEKERESIGLAYVFKVCVCVCLVQCPCDVGRPHPIHSRNKQYCVYIYLGMFHVQSVWPLLDRRLR